MNNEQHVFLVGAKSLGAYGGYETFINKLTEYHQNDTRIKYHVACKANGDGAMDPDKTAGVVIINSKEFLYHNAHCFRIKIPEKIGSAQAIYYDCISLRDTIKIIKTQRIEHPIIYIMACRIGPFIKIYHRQIKALGGKIYLNPDGHEWMRKKWNSVIRKYWKLSEAIMVKYNDLVICDSLNIEKYIHECYDGKGKKKSNPTTTYIAYGAESRKSLISDSDPEFVEWLKKNALECGEYYLSVGRFVPENNFETMIREFIGSRSKRNFAIITNVNDKFLSELEERVAFRKDNRIKFVGTVYNQELLMKIRENAYGYFHGHEVGGTNPSLLEALGSTKLNLLLDVGFNEEVAKEAAVYWTKDIGNLAALIDKIDQTEAQNIEEFGKKAKKRIEEEFSWNYICDRYAEVFLK